MAANNNDIQDDIAEALQCTICLQLLSNPRTLHCNHTYCKVCLDGLLQFTDEQGSARIKCPLRCEGVTTIPHDKTTNTLPMSHQLNSVLELLGKENEQQPNNNDNNNENNEKKYICSESEECTSMVSLYCRVCSNMLCSNCRDVHDAKHEEKKYMPITLDDKTDSLTVVCAEHESLANFVCCDNEFICVYCKHRKHLGHSCQTVSESAERIRMMITNPRAVMEADIAQARRTFEQALRQRRIRCILNYVEHLNREEEEILQTLDSTLTLSDPPDGGDGGDGGGDGDDGGGDGQENA